MTPVESCVLSKDADHCPECHTYPQAFVIHFGTTNHQPGSSRLKRISRAPI